MKERFNITDKQCELLSETTINTNANENQIDDESHIEFDHSDLDDSGDRYSDWVAENERKQNE